jgi:hypothetical protein
MTWIVVVLIVAGAISVSALVGGQNAPTNVWRQLALSRGGVYFDHAVRPAIEVDVRDARVRLEVDLGRPDAPNGALTCRARYLVPLGPVFRVEAGSVGPIGKLAGAQDVTLGGDRAFDESFIVKADEPSAVRRVWSAQAMRLMFRSLRDARARSNGREIELARSEIHSPAVMNAMIDLVGELASADLFGIAALRALPGATYQPPTGPWNERTTPGVVIEHPAPVTLMPVLIDGRVVTRATVGDGPRAQRVELTVGEDGRVEPADGAALLPPAAAALVDRLGSGTLVIDGADTAFTWRTVETDAGRLLAGAELLAILARGPALGAYR